MAAIVNVATYLVPVLLTEADGVTLVTTKVNADWTKTARLLGGATTATPTITHKANGVYDISFTPTAIGNWSVEYSVVVDGATVLFDPQLVQVIAATADPAALATAVAAVQETVDTIETMTDVATSTRATPGSYITTGSAAATSGAVTVYQGDDQVAVASRSLDWSSTTADQWPDLTGATIRLSGQYRANAANTVSATGSVITPTGATKHVRVELSAAQTEALHDGVYEIQVIATTNTGKVVTLVDTTMTVKPRKGP